MQDDDSTTRILSDFRKQYRTLNDSIDDLDVSVGWSTPNEIVYQQGPMRLRRFGGGTNSVSPLLIVYSHVNRPFVIDLARERSLVQAMCDRKHCVYLVEWRPVSPGDCTTDLSVYVDDSINAAVDWVLAAHDLPAVNMVGICQGGTFALCYASLYPNKIARLVTMVTPVDFHAGDSLLARWARHIDFDALIASPKNVPGVAITAMFQAMRPFDDMARQVNQIRSGDDSDSLAFAIKMDRWVYDCPDQPGRAFGQFAGQCFQDNALIKNRLLVGSKTINLLRIVAPVLNVFATTDHLVPAESARALGRNIKNGSYKELPFTGGHIGLLVSQRSLETVIPAVDHWLQGK